MNFTSANLENSDLSRAFLRGAILKDANLTNTNLLQAELAYTDLSNANLSNANLKQTDLISADFSNANISGTNMLLSYSKDAKFNDVIITDDTKIDSCFQNGFLDKVICQVSRNLNPDSPPFYGEMRNYHRDDLF